MSKPLCIYHGNCADGFGAAWVVWKYFDGECDFHAGVYQDPPPDVNGRDVIIVDFSYKRPVIEAMAVACRTLVIIDHHKTAADDLAGFPAVGVPYSIEGMLHYRMECNAPVAVHALFDMSRSGAGLAWDYFFPNDRRPRLIDHIEDRDLWKFDLPFTREIQAALFSHPYDFELWNKLIVGDWTNRLAMEGEAIERKHHKDVAELVRVCKRPMKIGGHVVPAASLPYTLTSDAGHLMAADAPFAACYWDTPDGRVFSLRSRDGGADVSEIAKLYGGGGHRNAAGFRVPYERLPEFIA